MGGYFRQVHRQAGATDDDLGATLYGGLHQLLVVGEGHHHVDADNAVRRDLIGLAHLVLEGIEIGLKEVCAVIEGAVEGDTRSRHQSDPAAFGHVTGQPSGRDTYPHATLDDRVADDMLTNP